jgi:NADPH-dependent glutamate synthase beta subunit-like oxidoreductase
MTRIVIDPEACVGCGDCSLICPVSVFRVLPPPCQSACPLDSDVHTYISLIAQERFDEALASIELVNPFPGIVGRVCTNPCEKQCRRGGIDEPIAIRALKRFAVEFGGNLNRGELPLPSVKKKKVAIVGSGPAGLMAGHDLAKLGYQVTIFESLPVAGGMLSVGIPEYRLPREIIKAEIAQIENIGVEIKLNTTIGKDRTLMMLLEQGYTAILIATGAHGSLGLDIPRENVYNGTEYAISFLREVNLGRKRNFGGRAIVVGGGNAAMDSSRMLLRLGCDEVDVIYRRTKQEMPVFESEVIEAEREGVKIHYLVAPVRVVGKDGKVVGIECIRTKPGNSDASGRAIPVPVSGSEFSMDCNYIILAMGQKPDLLFRHGCSDLAISGDFVKVDPETMATNLPGIFAAGDVVNKPGTVIDALLAGRKAAVSIDRYLRKDNLRQEGEKEAKARIMEQERIWWREIPKRELGKEVEVPVRKRFSNFNEVTVGLTKLSAVREANRCLGCAIFAHMDEESCCGESCRACQYSCWKGAITVMET